MGEYVLGLRQKLNYLAKAGKISRNKILTVLYSYSTSFVGTVPVPYISANFPTLSLEFFLVWALRI